MNSNSTRLLKLALPLVKNHGFTREALANSVLHLPPPETHTSPLSDAAISSLFGNGSQAQRALINHFLDSGVEQMKLRAQIIQETQNKNASVKEVLEERLKWNEPVLEHLTEAFALLATSGNESGTILGKLEVLRIPPVDPLPAFKHTWKVADEACYLSGDTSAELSWYARRTSLAAIYAATELHQITSPHTTSQFLDSLLASSTNLKKSVDEIGLFSSYLLKSFKGIAKSSGMI